jgi:signal peptidase
VGLPLVMLALLWTFSLRALVQRSWERASFRLSLDLPATVDGVEVRTRDGSPDAVGVAGDLSGTELAVGAHVDVTVRLDDGATLVSSGVVAARRRRGGEDLLGLRLELDDRSRDRWLHQLFSAFGTSATRVVPALTAVPVSRSRWRDRLVVSLVVAVSTPVLCALLLVLFGFQPLVIRSGSMVPSLGVGDVVLSQQVPVTALRPGDVVTVHGSDLVGDSITHRVRNVTATADGVRLETRGDANVVSERWTVSSTATVGRVRWSVPWIGAPATVARGALVQLTLAALGLLALVWGVSRRGASPAVPAVAR